MPPLGNRIVNRADRDILARTPPARCARAATSPNPEIAPRNFARLAISADKFQLNQSREQPAPLP